MRCINLPLTLTVTLRCCLAGRMRLADRSGRLCRRMSACVARLPGHLPCRRPLFPDVYFADVYCSPDIYSADVRCSYLITSFRKSRVELVMTDSHYDAADPVFLDIRPRSSSSAYLFALKLMQY